MWFVCYYYGSMFSIMVIVVISSEVLNRKGIENFW